MRIFRRIAVCFLLFTVLGGGGMGVANAAESLPAPQTSARAAVLMDQYGQVLYAHNGEERLPMASTTKIMTALVAIESGAIDRTLKIPPAAVGVEGSSAYLIAGETMTLQTLLYALMLESANDAAVAIAIATFGSVDAFVEQMNAKAEALGLVNTHFENPHGLDHESHYTTALDLAKLTVTALENEIFAEIVSTVRFSASVNGAEAHTRLFLNHNRLLREYEGCIGVKTGYTKRSGRCLVSAARQEDITLVAITLNDPSDWQDHRRLLDYGFSVCDPITVANNGEYRYTLPVVGGVASSVTAVSRDALTLTLWQDSTLKARVELPRFLYGGIRKGDRLGQAVLTVNGKEAAILPLYAEADVPAAVYPKSFWQRICDGFLAAIEWLAGLFQ